MRGFCLHKTSIGGYTNIRGVFIMNMKVNTKSAKETVKEIKKGAAQIKKEVDAKYGLEDSKGIIDAVDRKTHILDR